MTERWRIDELVRVVEEALSNTGGGGQHSGRVRRVPDRRTIRYYTTLGLLEKPVEMRGRTAYYSRRHALQLVVIKRLQARGLSLAEVQQSLAGADGGRLKRWAALSEGFWQRTAAEVSARPPPPSADQVLAARARPSGEVESVTDRLGARFWATVPETRDTETACLAAADERVLPRAALHLHVSKDVKLVIDRVDWSNASEAALADLAPALGSLRAALRRSGLVAREQLPERPADQHGSHQEDQNNEERS